VPVIPFGKCKPFMAKRVDDIDYRSNVFIYHKHPIMKLAMMLMD